MTSRTFILIAGGAVLLYMLRPKAATSAQATPGATHTHATAQAALDAATDARVAQTPGKPAVRPKRAHRRQ